MPPPQEAHAKSDEIVVFILRTETECSECRRPLLKGNFLRLEKKRPLCLDCADLGRLEYLPRGDTAVTRRTTKYSALRAVVVQWSRTRKRYERQGILAPPEAIRRAEEESLADAPLRERRRVQEALRREVEDRDYIAAVTLKLKELFPGCPLDEARAIAEHACQKHSGRVGRSAAAKEFDPKALRLAVIAHIRHQHTPYDHLLGRLGDRQLARAEVRRDMERLLAQWEGPAKPARPAEHGSPSPPVPNRP
jgi:hypothetical protein